MSNLIRYIIQEDPEKQMKKNDLDYVKYPTWAPIQKQSQEDKYKGYKFSSKNLLENSFNSLTSNKSSQSKDEGSFMSGISNIFNNIKSDEKSSSNASLPQSIAKTAAEESSKIGTALSPNQSEMIMLHTKLLKITKEILQMMQRQIILTILFTEMDSVKNLLMKWSMIKNLIKF